MNKVDKQYEDFTLSISIVKKWYTETHGACISTSGAERSERPIESATYEK